MTETRRAETAWLAVLAATACGVVVAMNIGKLPIALPLLRGEFGLSLTAAGWLAAAFSTLAMVSGAAIGIVADRLGALRFCLFGLAASTVGGLMGLTGTSENQLLISRIVEGVGFLAVAVSAPALVSAASAPAHIRLTLGIWSCYMPAGASLCVLLAPLFLERGGWRGLWWLVLLLLLAAFLTLILQRRHFVSAAAGRHQGLTEVRGALLQPVPWLLTLAFAAYALQFFAVVIWLPTFLQEQRDMPDALIALLSALVIAANVPGNLAGAALLYRHVNRGRLIAGVSLVMGLAGLGIFHPDAPDSLRYLCCLVLTGVGGVIPVAVLSSSVVLAANPQQIGTLQGLYVQGSNLGQFAGIPLIAGVVAASGQWQSALMVTAPAALSGIVLGLLVARSGK